MEWRGDSSGAAGDEAVSQGGGELSPRAAYDCSDGVAGDRQDVVDFLWAGLIAWAFPRAVIIHCRRTAVDTALSIHETHFHPTLAFPTGGAELVAYFRSYRRIIDHWRSLLPADRFIEDEIARS